MFATFRLDPYENPILQCLSNAPVNLFPYSGFGESFGRLLGPIRKCNSAVPLKRSRKFVSLLCHPPQPPLPRTTILGPQKLRKQIYGEPFRALQNRVFICVSAKKYQKLMISDFINLRKLIYGERLRGISQTLQNRFLIYI